VRIEKLVKEHNVRIRWVHFPLHPETPQEGQTLEALFAGRGKDIPQMQAQMKAHMQAEGLPYGDLGSWADTQPGGSAIHDALFRAYFVDGRNVGDTDVLVEVAESVGLPAEQAREVLEQRTFREAVDADWALSRQYGVTGVPTYVAGQRGVIGAQPYEALVQLVEQARAGG
jgi:predicted DsbA family dithiol-disulfide isomerase